MAIFVRDWAHIQEAFYLPLTLEYLCRKFPINRTMINEMFKVAIGKTAIDSIESKIRDSVANVDQYKSQHKGICDPVGFTDASHFSRTFKKNWEYYPPIWKKAFP